MATFLETIAQFTSLSPESKDALLGVTTTYELPKGHVLIHADTICHHAYYIEQGLARTYYYKDGKDITDWLGAEGDFVVSIVSFLTRHPDRRIVELLEPATVCAIPYSGLETLYSKYHDVERLGRLLVSHGLILLQQRFDRLHFSTARERYEEMLRSNPTFIQRVPLGMIASYLGITQETLSRIRAQL